MFAERPDVDLNLRPETHARVTEHGVRLLRHLSLPPGRYQLRVAAQDSGKVRQGSAHLDLDVPDFTKASDRAQQRRARGDMPTARCIRRRSPASIRSTDCCPARRRRCASFRTTARSPPRSRCTTTSRRPSTASTSQRVSEPTMAAWCSTSTRSDRREELHGTPGGFGYTFRIPIQDWTPGLYVLEVEAKSRLNGAEPVTTRHSVRGEVDEIRSDVHRCSCACAIACLSSSAGAVVHKHRQGRRERPADRAGR